MSANVAAIRPWPAVIVRSRHPRMLATYSSMEVSLLQAIHVESAVLFLGAFDLFGKPREFVAPLLERVQVLDPRAVGCADVFAGHHDGYARWIGDDANTNDAVGELGQRHLFRIAGHQLLERAARHHLGPGQRGV